jgi:hypothetical protein
MPIALLALAVCTLAAVMLGPLGLGWLQWRVGPNLINQTYGADGAQLVFVMPAAAVAAYLWWRGHRLAAPLALGVGLATLYYAVASVLGADYVRQAGNNERYFSVFLALIVLSWTTAARAWSALDANPPRPPVWLARGFAGVLGAASAVIGIGWMAQLLDITLSGALSSTADALAYAEAPTAFWLVRIVDLGFLVPLSAWTAIGLWRGSATAVKAAYGVATFITLQVFAVLAMGAVMLARNDPTATPVLVYVLTPIALAGAALTASVLASYARGAPRRDLA